MMVTGDAAADDMSLQITRTCDPPGLTIAGEIDESNYADLLTVLAVLVRATDWPGQELHVNLAAVRSCDLAGLRAILLAAIGEGDGGSQGSRAGRGGVVLHDVPPELTAVLHVLGWDDTPVVAISERADDSQRPERSTLTGTGGPVIG